MARRRKKEAKTRRAASVTLAPVNMDANIKAELMPVEVENPYYTRDHGESGSNPKNITAFINVRESAVETLYARGVLNKAQKKAADRFRAIWEAMGGAGAGAMDYTREFVDGGGPSDPISVKQMEAGRDLKECRLLLGARGFDLVRRICGEGHALQEVAQAKRDRLTMADNLRAHLDDLADMWGIQTKRRSVA